MKIFVTVGTTAFDELIETIDTSKMKHDFILQISKKSKYKPKNYPYFDFTDDIEMYYSQADAIVTHSGAGSVYRLLELKKKIIIVPNLLRVDKHQSDLSNFMKKNHYAIVCDDIKYINKSIEDIEKYEFREYRFDPFFKASEILEFMEVE